MALPNIRGFVTPEQEFGGIYQAGEIIQRNRYRDEQQQREREGRLAATGKFLTDYLDPKDRLTGTAYDPEIVRQLNDALVEGAELAKKGAGTSDILMALGPKVGRISEYSQKAKLVNKAIGDAVAKLKPYKGYNTDALAEEAKKMAFYDEGGKLKDITTVDPNVDWVTETVKTRPDLVTTSAGLEDFIAKTPMREYANEVQTMFGGRKKNVKYDAKSPFWMDVQTDEQGNAITDKSGNPVGLGVKSEIWKDDKGQPLIDPETKQPYKMLGKPEYNSIMAHNPDVADWVRGQVVSTFRQMGEKVPAEDSPQWEGMARNILHDELKTRDKSFFKTRDLETKSPIVTKIELGLPTQGGGSGAAGADVNDVYGRVYSELKRLTDYGEKEVKPSLFKADEQKAISDGLAGINTGKKEEDKIKLDDVWLKLSDQDEVLVLDADRRLLFTLPKLATNLPKQANVKGKAKVVAQGEPDKSAKPKQVKKDPLGLF